MNIQKFLFLLLGAVCLSACSSAVEEKRQLYRQSESIEPLKVPGHLDRPLGSEVYELPIPDKAALGEQPFDSRPPVNLPEEALQSSESAESDSDSDDSSGAE